jgi:hypothetical protein
MDKFLNFLEGFNIQTIISMVVIFWYFTRDIKSEMKLLESKIDTQAARSDRLYEMFIDLIKEGKSK